MHHILIVEDSPTMRSLVVSALEDLGAPVKITEAASGFEALRELPRGDYDLIVTDSNMPDINGLELGADAYLVKPFDPDALRRTAKELLQKARGE